MFGIKDDTFNITREKAYFGWLDEMETHEDLAVRDGVQLARDYVDYLKQENARLREENELKNSYLKRTKNVIDKSLR